MSNKKKLLVLLHGYGADGNDLLPIGEHIKKKIPNIEFISPNAFDRCELNPSGYQWFHIDEDRRYIFDQNIQNVTDRVFNEYIKKEAEKRSLDISDVILCGFSQGGMISLAVGLRSIEKPLAVISLSGLLMNEIIPVGEQQPNILMMHGSLDDVVPINFYENSKNQLDRQKIIYNCKSYENLSHSISLDEIEDLISYIETIISEN
jgi:phospholipase/carboxylesterase